MLAEDFLRVLYREGYLEPGDFQERHAALQRLRDGELRPVLADRD